MTATPSPADGLRECLALLTRMYNYGYAAGHNRTVEGGYVNVVYADRGDYHREEVEELLAEDDHGPALLAALRLREGCEGLVATYRNAHGHENDDAALAFKCAADDLARVLEESATGDEACSA